MREINGGMWNLPNVLEYCDRMYAEDRRAEGAGRDLLGVPLVWRRQ